MGGLPPEVEQGAVAAAALVVVEEVVAVEAAGQKVLRTLPRGG